MTRDRCRLAALQRQRKTRLARRHWRSPWRSKRWPSSTGARCRSGRRNCFPAAKWMWCWRSSRPSGSRNRSLQNLNTAQDCESGPVTAVMMLVRDALPDVGTGSLMGYDAVMRPTTWVVLAVAGALALLWGGSLWLLSENVAQPASVRPGPLPDRKIPSRVPTPASADVRGEVAPPSRAAVDTSTPPSGTPRTLGGNPSLNLPPGASVAIDPFAADGPSPVIVYPGQPRPPMRSETRDDSARMPAPDQQ